MSGSGQPAARNFSTAASRESFQSWAPPAAYIWLASYRRLPHITMQCAQGLCSSSGACPSCTGFMSSGIRKGTTATSHNPLESQAADYLAGLKWQLAPQYQATRLGSCRMFTESFPSRMAATQNTELIAVSALTANIQDLCPHFEGSLRTSDSTQSHKKLQAIDARC